MIVRKIVIRFCNNIRHFSNKRRKFDKKGHNEGRPLKLSIFELESSLIAQNDREKNRHWFLQ